MVATRVSMLALVGVQLLAPWIISRMVDTTTESRLSPESLRTMSRLALLALGVYIVRAVMQLVRSYLSHVAGLQAVAETQRHIFTHLQRLSMHYYEDKQTGELMSRVINDTRLFEQLIAHAIPDVMVNILSLIAICAESANGEPENKKLAGRRGRLSGAVLLGLPGSLIL